MLKNWEKILFVTVIVGVAFFSRQAYPTISALPTVAALDGTTTTAARTTPPIIVLAAPSLADIGQSVDPEQQGTSTATNNSTVAFVKTGNAPMPVFSATASLIAELDNGAVIAATNADKRWPTASLTKLMTATIIFDNVSLNTKITITPAVFATDPDEYTLVPGGTYTVNDLLHVMLMPSSNVAAEALASYYGRARFMEEMNARAAAWGMKNTYFDDPSGISAANQSTANDMLILAGHVYNDYPQIFAVTRTADISIIELNSGKKVNVKSINDFAGDPNFVGGKTGHTNEAGGNLLSTFEYNTHPLLIIVLGTADRFINTQKMLTWFKANYK